MLLTSEASHTGTDLFALPDTAVSRVSTRQEKRNAMHPAQGGDLGGRRGVQVEDPSSRPSELAEADTHSEMSAKVRRSIIGCDVIAKKHNTKISDFVNVRTLANIGLGQYTALFMTM